MYLAMVGLCCAGQTAQQPFNMGQTGSIGGKPQRSNTRAGTIGALWEKMSMCEDLQKELEAGIHAAEQVVAHVMRMGAQRASIPVTVMDPDHGPVLWTVRVFLGTEEVNNEPRR